MLVDRDKIEDDDDDVFDRMTKSGGNLILARDKV
jgi:hypothetical protein